MANRIGQNFIDDEEGNKNSFFLKQPPRILGLGGERLTPLEPNFDGDIDTHSQLLGGMNKKFETFIDHYEKDRTERSKVNIVIKKELHTISTTLDDIYDILAENRKWELKERKLDHKYKELHLNYLNMQMRQLKRDRSKSKSNVYKSLGLGKLGRTVGKYGSNALGTAVGGLFDTLLPGLASAGIGGFLGSMLLLGGRGLWGLGKSTVGLAGRGIKGLWGLGARGSKGLWSKFTRTGATRVATGTGSRMATTGAIDMVRGSDGVWRMAGSQATRSAGTQLAVRGAGSTALRTAGSQVALRGGGAVAGTVAGGTAIASAGALLAVLAAIPVIKWGVGFWDKWTKEQKYGNELTEQMLEELKKPKWYDHLLDFLSALPLFNGIGLNKYDLPRLNEELVKNEQKDTEEKEKMNQAVNNALEKQTELFNNLGKKTEELTNKFEEMLPDNKFGNFIKNAVESTKAVNKNIATGTSNALKNTEIALQKGLDDQQKKLYQDFLKSDPELQAIDKYANELKAKHGVTSGVEFNRTVVLPNGKRQTRNHYGTDFGTSVGTALTLPFDAVVTTQNQPYGGGNATFGKYIEARSGNYMIRSAHLSNYGQDLSKLPTGNSVNLKAGTVFGYSGQTGGVAPHNHFEVRKILNGTQYIVDPINKTVYMNNTSTQVTKTLEKMQKAAQDKIKEGFEKTNSWLDNLLGIFDHFGEMLSPVADEIQKSIGHGKLNKDIQTAVTWDVGNQYKNAQTDQIRKHYQELQDRQNLSAQNRAIYPLKSRDDWETNSLPVQGASYGGIDISTGLFEKMALFVQQ